MCVPDGLNGDNVVCCNEANKDKSFCDVSVESNKCMAKTIVEAGATTIASCPSNTKAKCGG